MEYSNLIQYVVDLMDDNKPFTQEEYDKSEYRNKRHYAAIRNSVTRKKTSLNTIIFFLEPFDYAELPWMVVEKLEKHMKESGMPTYRWYKKYWDNNKGYHKDISSLSIERLDKFVRQTKTPVESLFYDSVEDFVVRK